MARISGVDIPNNKRVVISLTYIYGIGKPTAEEILKNANVSVDKRVKDYQRLNLLQFVKRLQNIMLKVTYVEKFN